MVNGTDADEVKNIKKMSAEEVIQKTRYKKIDLIAADPNLLDINLAILQNKIGRQDNILKFTSTESCYKIVRELREKNYKIFPHIRGGKTTQNWLDRVINEQKSIFEISPTSGFAKDLMKFIENLVGK